MMGVLNFDSISIPHIACGGVLTFHVPEHSGPDGARVLVSTCSVCRRQVHARLSEELGLKVDGGSDKVVLMPSVARPMPVRAQRPAQDVELPVDMPDRTTLIPLMQLSPAVAEPSAIEIDDDAELRAEPRNERRIVVAGAVTLLVALVLAAGGWWASLGPNPEPTPIGQDMPDLPRPVGNANIVPARSNS